MCNVIVGNLFFIIIYWIKLGDFEFKEFGLIFVFLNVSRSYSGRYFCVVENNYLNGGKGIDKELFVLDVLCRYLFFL